MARANPSPLNILLLGKTGSGKSCIGNALLCQGAFAVSSGMFSTTTEFQASSGNHKSSGQLLTVVDSPDLTPEIDGSQCETAQTVRESLAKVFQLCPSDGFHLVLFVVRLDVRFTQEERLALSCITDVLGDDGLARVGIVVFSHGDCVENDEAKFKSRVKEIREKNAEMDELIRRCSDRYCMVDASRTCEPELQQEQTRKLLEMVNTGTVMPFAESEMTAANPTGSSILLPISLATVAFVGILCFIYHPEIFEHAMCLIFWLRDGGKD